MPVDECWTAAGRTTDRVRFGRSDEDGDTTILTERIVGAQRGKGSLNLDFLLYSLAGFDLSSASKATLKRFAFPPDC